MKTFTLSFLIAMLVFIAVPSAYAATQLEETIALMQRTSPLPANIQSAVTSFVQTTCGFGAFNGGLTIKNNLKNDFSTWPSDIRTRLQACADANPAVVTSIQNQLLALSSQPSTTPATPTTPTQPAGQTVPARSVPTVQPTSISIGNGFVPIAPIPELTNIQPSTGGLADFFNNLYKFLIGIAAVLAVIMIIWGGLEISTQDSVSKQGAGREKIQNAILGLVLVLSPVLVFSIINPSILNLSINLQPLDTKYTTEKVQDAESVDTTSECAVTGTSGLLLVARCDSLQKAQDWVAKCSENTDIGGTLFFSSEPTVKTNPTNGIKTYISVCSTTKKFVFIDTSSTYFSIINQFRPLVSTSNNSNNGSEAMSFAGICKRANLGLQTCVSDTASLSGVVPCNLTGANADTSWKCYEQTLTCRDANTTNPKCTSSVDWVPFQ